jgi:hypothetical protein
MIFTGMTNPLARDERWLPVVVPSSQGQSTFGDPLAIFGPLYVSADLSSDVAFGCAR